MVTVITRLRPASRSLALFFALVLLCGSSGGALSAQPRGRTFFGAAPPGHAPADPHRRPRPAPKRSRMAAVRADLLAADDSGTTPPLDLNLFDDLTVRVRVHRVERHSPRAFVWHGRLEGVNGYATFASTDGVLAGTVFTDAATFEVAYAGDGLYEVSELDPTAFPTDDPTADLVPPPGASSPAAASVADSAAQEDVLVVWTPAARVAAGGASAIESLIDLAIANANTAYANSGVAMRLRLVHKGEVSYDESSISTDLSRLASTADGYVDGVHALRDRYGADIVSMVGAGYTTAGSCGIGYLMSSVGSWFAGSAFNVVDWSCAAGNLSMAHEIGHNQGLHHDPAHADGQAAYPYAYGYIDPGCGFRTVMAYGSCRRVTQFSSPTHHYTGLVTGTSVQDNARALNSTAATVANFRQQASSSCSYSLSTQSVTAAAGGQSASVSVTAAAGCSWTASSSASWISITSGASATGSGSVTLSVAANTGTSSRTGTVTIAGTAVTVTQEAAAACSYVLSASSATVPAVGGTGSFNVTPASGCAWTAATDAAWLTITSGASGSGSGTVKYSAAPNSASAARTGAISVATQTFTVSQPARSGRAQPPWSFDRDSKNDIAIWRPSSGQWLTLLSGGGWLPVDGWGVSGDVAVPADYDGDGRLDTAVWRPSTGTWYILFTSGGWTHIEGWGNRDDVPVSADYDGDGKADYAVWRPSTGSWYVMFAKGGWTHIPNWGLNGDVAFAGDFDGDRKADPAVWRPSTGTWYVLLSNGGWTYYSNWGLKTDTPVPGDYDGDGRTDPAVFRPSTGGWLVLLSSGGWMSRTGPGTSGDVAVPGDYDGDGATDRAVWRPNTGKWLVELASGGTLTWTWGLAGDVPLARR